MDNFVHHNPTRVLFGTGMLERLGKELKKLSCKKILIVIGGGSVKNNGALDKVLDQCEKAEVETVLFEGIKPNPADVQVEEAAQVARKTACEAVLALGGGSVMDAAKVIALLAVQDGKAWDYTIKFGENRKAIKNALPIITIPTLAATGSEADPIAVISNHELKKKQSISGSALYPKLAVVDPNLTLSCPKGLTIDGLVDVIAHSSETYFSSPANTPIQDGISLQICKTVFDYGQKVLKNPGDLDARSQIMWASTLAMNGTLSGRNGGWPMHAIEHEISGHYPDISHGSGLAALFRPIVLWDAENANIEKLQGFISSILGKTPENINECKQFLDEIFNTLEADISLKSLGVTKADFESIVDGVLATKANKNGELINIAPMKREDILAILDRAY